MPPNGTPLSQLAVHCPSMLWQGNTTGKRSWFNEAWIEFVGPDHRDMLHDDWLQLVHPEDQSLCIGIQSAIAQNLQPFQIEYRMRHHSGDYRWLLDHASPLPDQSSMVGSTIDIDERKKAEHQLNQKEIDSAAMLAQAGVGIALIHLIDGTINRSNARMAHFLKASPSQIEGSNLLSYIHSDHHERVARLFKKAKEKRAPIRIHDVKFVTSRSRITYADLIISPVIHDLHQATIVVQSVMVHREKLQNLEDRNDKLNEFAAASSHDLQAPLRSICLQLDLLHAQAADKLSEDQQALLKQAIQSTEYMQKMVSGVLQYIRTDSDQHQLETIQLGHCLNQAIENLHAEIINKKAQIQFGDLPQVHGHFILLTQCLQNLLGNSLKHIPDEDGTITISAEQDPDHNEWIISVSDNGPGIAQDHHNSIFRLFTSHDQQGCGIGLAFCKRAVEACGGDIWYEPETNGALFCFSLQAAP